MNVSMKVLFLCGSVLSTGFAAQAAEISMALNSTGKNVNFIRERLAEFEKQSGHKVKMVTMPPSSSEQFSQYRLWLAAGNTDIDVYQTDVVWAPQLAEQFVDLTDAAKDVVAKHFPSVIASQTVDGKLVAMPMYTDAPALFYRRTSWKNTASSHPRPGLSCRRQPRKSRTRSAKPDRRICGVSCSRAAPMRA